jgi:hypothetical protein
MINSKITSSNYIKKFPLGKKVFFRIDFNLMPSFFVFLWSVKKNYVINTYNK